MRWNFRPSKPQAIFVALVGVGLLVVGIASVNDNVPFLIFWCVVVVGIVSLNVWSAFARGGSLYHADSSGDQPPARPGSRAERARDS
jgi:hypothetical protein